MYSSYCYREEYRFDLEVIDAFTESEEKVCTFKGKKEKFTFFVKSKEMKDWKMDWQSVILMENTIYLTF